MLSLQIMNQNKKLLVVCRSEFLKRHYREMIEFENEEIIYWKNLKKKL